MYELNTTNTKLASHVKAIQKLDTATKKAVFETAVRLNIIATEGWAKEEGFKSIVDFAQQVFGYSRSTTHNYIKIAERFLDVRIGKNNKMEIATIQARRDADGNVVSDYNIGQLNAIGKLSQDDFIRLDNEEVIDPSMSQKEIKDAVKAWEQQFIIDEQPQEQEQEQDNENTPMDIIEMIIQDIVKLEYKLYDNDAALNTLATIKQNIEQLYGQV